MMVEVVKNSSKPECEYKVDSEYASRVAEQNKMQPKYGDQQPAKQGGIDGAKQNKQAGP